MTGSRRELLLRMLLPALFVGAFYVAWIRPGRLRDLERAAEALEAARRGTPKIEEIISKRNEGELWSMEIERAQAARREALEGAKLQAGSAVNLARLLAAHDLGLARELRGVDAAKELDGPLKTAVRAAPERVGSITFRGRFLDALDALDELRAKDPSVVPLRLVMERAESGGAVHEWTLTVWR